MADSEPSTAATTASPAPAEETQAAQKRPLETDDNEDSATKAAKLDTTPASALTAAVPTASGEAAAAPTASAETAAAPPTTGADPSDTDNGVPKYLPKRVQEALEKLYASGQVGRHDLDKQALDSLRDFSEDLGVEIVDKYREADLSGIRNKTAFFIGIIKRYRARGPQHPPALAPGPQGSAPAPQSAPASMVLSQPRAELFPSTQKKLDELYASGKAVRDELGDVITQLKVFTEDTANTIVDKYAEADTAQIRSRTGFFMGIIRRFQDQAASQQSSANLVAFHQLPYSVQIRLSPYYSNGVIGQNDIEARVFQSLAQFNEHTCNEIVSKFLESDLTRVSNKSGWLIGIIKRFRSTGAVSHPSNAALHQANNQQYLASMTYGGYAPPPPPFY